MTKEKIIVPVEIEREYRKLLRMTHHSIHPIDANKIRQAFTLVTNTIRANQLPDTHPMMLQSLITAQIVVSEIGLGTTSTICALIYHFVEKGQLDLYYIKETFGPKSCGDARRDGENNPPRPYQLAFASRKFPQTLAYHG